MISANLVKDLREKTGAGMLDCKKALEATNGNIDEAVDWLREKGISKAAKKADRIAAEGTSAILVQDEKAVIVEVNSETDFVAKNEEFQSMIKTILESIINNEVNSLEDVLALPSEEGTINDLIIAKTAKIGEKLSLRRFEKIVKTPTQNFGSYIHMGGRIAVLTLVEGANLEVAKDVAMHSAAMRPQYVSIREVPNEVVDHERVVLKEQAINEGKPAEIAEKMVEGRIQKFYKEVCLEEQPFVKDGDITVSSFVKNNGGTVLRMVRYEVGEGMEKRCDNFADEVMNQINK
jgi:elongation factor Ts